MGKKDIKKAIAKEQWKKTDTILWVLIFTVFFSILVDLVLLNIRSWTPIFSLKFIYIALSVLIYKFSKKDKIAPNYVLHFAIASFNILCILLILEQGNTIKLIYSSLLVCTFCVINMFAIWNTRNSIFQFLFIFVFCAILYKQNFIRDFDFYLDKGGYVLSIIAGLTCFFPKLRKLTFEDEISEKNRKEEEISLLNKEVSLTKAKLELINRRIVNSFEKFNDFNTENNQKITEITNHAKSLLGYEEDPSKKEKIHQIKSLSKQVAKTNDLVLQELDLQSTSTKSNSETQEVDIYDWYKKTLSNYLSSVRHKKINLNESLYIDVENCKIDSLALEIALDNTLDFITEVTSFNSEIDITITSNTKLLSFEFNSKEIQMDFSDNTEQNNFNHKLNLSKQIVEYIGGYYTYAFSNKMGTTIHFQFNKLNHSF